MLPSTTQAEPHSSKMTRGSANAANTSSNDGRAAAEGMDTGLGGKLVALKVVLSVVLTCFSDLSSNCRHGKLFSLSGRRQRRRGQGHGRQLGDEPACNVGSAN